MVATAVGLLSAVGFGFGDLYGGDRCSALLFQLAAIIDCCDGEVARLALESPFGAWLDIAMDNVVHIAIFAGIACGSTFATPMRRRRGCHWRSEVACSVMPWRSGWSRRPQKISATRGWNTRSRLPGQTSFSKMWRAVIFSVVVFLFALADKLDWFLWMAALQVDRFPG